jgi:hypothetical protein
MLRDYLDTTLHAVVQAPPSERRVRLQFGVEQLDEPA